MKKLKKFVVKKGFFISFQIFVILILIFINYNTNFFYSIDRNFYKFFNSLFFETPEKIENINNKIILVKIDENFFQKENISIQWLHRWYYAKAIKNLLDKKVKAIGVDVFFEKKYHFKESDKYTNILNKIFNKYDSELVKVLNEKVILWAIYDKYKKTFLLPSNFFLKNWAEIGHVNSHPDPNLNNINTAIYGPIRYINNYIWPLSIKTYQIANKTSFVYKDNKIFYLKNNQPTYILIRKTYDWLPIVFFPFYITNNWENATQNISLYDVVYKTGDFNKLIRENKIVLIGVTDPTLNDYKMSIYWLLPWIIFHYNLLWALINKEFIYIFSKIQTIKLVILMLIINLFIILTIKYRKWEKDFDLLLYYIWSFTLLSIVWSLIFIHYSKDIYQWNWIFLPVWSILLNNLIFLTFSSLYTIVEGKIKREVLDKLVNLYIWEHIKRLKTNYSLDEISKKTSKKENVTIFFSDIENFTKISESLSPEETVKMINIYLEEMSQYILLKKWIIDKYIGDAIMAFWTKEYQPDLAVEAAIYNIKSLPKINKIIKQQLPTFNYQLNCRIWLHWWEAILWDIGSSTTKYNFTIIWDNVNLASRLEWINKFYKTQICASEMLINKLENKENFIFRFLDIIRVKWKSKPVKIYQIFPFFKKELSPSQLENLSKQIKMFEEALNLYISWDWIKAKEIFEKIYEFFEDKTALIFVQRCEYLIKNPPENWEGIRKYKEK